MVTYGSGDKDHMEARTMRTCSTASGNLALQSQESQSSLLPESKSPVPDQGCLLCQTDLDFLRRQTRPSYEAGRDGVSVVDLFAGAGGFSLGISEACRRLGIGVSIKLAVDNNEAATKVFKDNFPKAEVLARSVEDIFGLETIISNSFQELGLTDDPGPIELLIGGPPCQGHSDLNNRTRRNDPRNNLYFIMAKAAEILKPRAILIENVPTVVHDAEGIVELAAAHLRKNGFQIASRFFSMANLGIPQSRKRHILLALRDVAADPNILLSSVAPLCLSQHPRTVRWAIEDILRLENTTPFDEQSRLSPENIKRIKWLFENSSYDLPNDLRPTCHRSEHSYRSMYGRLGWDRPAQTITTGYGSMGQGRYIHPERPRTLTPHEASRLQTFPDFFSFTSVMSRTNWANMIGNAVPPLMGVALGIPLIAALRSINPKSY
jgi:DNA (cytosine-5)-methyltransferase 1